MTRYRLKSQVVWSLFLLVTVLWSSAVFGFHHSNHSRFDFRGRDFAAQGPIALNGEWDFFWKQILYPEPFDFQGVEADKMMVPGGWNSDDESTLTFSNKGFATYHTHVLLKDSEIQWALKIENILSNFKVFVNGVLVASSGKVGAVEDIEGDVRHPVVISDSFQGSSLEIVIQVSNYTHARGGLYRQIILGPSKTIKEQVFKDIAFEMFLFGSIVIIGFFHLIRYLYRKEDRANLYFGLMCFLFSFRVSFMGVRFANMIFPNLGTDLSLKIEYLSIYLALPAFTFFIFHIFSKDFSRKVLVTTSILSFFLTMPIFIFGESVFMKTLPYFELLSILVFIYIGYIYYISIKRGQRDTWLIVGGFMSLSAATVNDILFETGTINTGFYLPLGFLGYILFQSMFLSFRSAQAFRRNEELTIQLAEINDSLEQRVKSRTQELKKRNEDLNFEIVEHQKTSEKLAAAKMKADEANQAKSEFLANMSHELRTPMHGILGFASFGIQKINKATKESLLKYFQEIRDCGDRLLMLLNDLLDLSKLESGKIIYDFAENDLNSVVRTVLGEISVLAEEKGITFKVEPPINGLSAMFDEGKLIQVLRNLVSNAIRYSDPDTEIRIRIEGDDEKITLSVIDQGVGIPEEELEDIFDKFVQSSKTNTHAGGTGLGLPICRKIINDHKGIIFARNNKHKGACVTFEIPKLQKQKKKLGEILVEQKLITQQELLHSLDSQDY